MSGIVKFSIVGAGGAILNTAVLYALYKWSRMPLLAASAVAVELAVINNYLWNDRWTFARRSSSFRRFVKFNVSSLGGVAVNVLSVLLLTRSGLNLLLADLIGIGAGLAANFFLSSSWVWAAA